MRGPRSCEHDIFWKKLNPTWGIRGMPNPGDVQPAQPCRNEARSLTASNRIPFIVKGCSEKMSSTVWLVKCKHARNSGFRADRVGNVGAKAGSTIGRLMKGLLGRDSCRDVFLRSLDVNWTASVVKTECSTAEHRSRAQTASCIASVACHVHGEPPPRTFGMSSRTFRTGMDLECVGLPTTSDSHYTSKDDDAPALWKFPTTSAWSAAILISLCLSENRSFILEV